MPPSDDLRSELQRRETCADKLEALLKSRPGEWIPIRELAHVGGIGGFRTRISELRLQRGMVIVHNGLNGASSCHRYLPFGELLGRDSAVPAPGIWPAVNAPYVEPWRLT